MLGTTLRWGTLALFFLFQTAFSQSDLTIGNNSNFGISGFVLSGDGSTFGISAALTWRGMADLEGTFGHVKIGRLDRGSSVSPEYSFTTLSIRARLAPVRLKIGKSVGSLGITGGYEMFDFGVVSPVEIPRRKSSIGYAPVGLFAYSQIGAERFYLVPRMEIVRLIPLEEQEYVTQFEFSFGPMIPMSEGAALTVAFLYRNAELVGSESSVGIRLTFNGWKGEPKEN